MAPLLKQQISLQLCILPSFANSPSDSINGLLGSATGLPKPSCDSYKLKAEEGRAGAELPHRLQAHPLPTPVSVCQEVFTAYCRMARGDTSRRAHRLKPEERWAEAELPHRHQAYLQFLYAGKCSVLAAGVPEAVQAMALRMQTQLWRVTGRS